MYKYNFQIPSLKHICLDGTVTISTKVRVTSSSEDQKIYFLNILLISVFNAYTVVVIVTEKKKQTKNKKQPNQNNQKAEFCTQTQLLS